MSKPKILFRRLFMAGCGIALICVSAMRAMAVENLIRHSSDSRPVGRDFPSHRGVTATKFDHN
jgi:hypothetical protein